MSDPGLTGAHDLRERIQSTARELFIRRGYHGLSMREIAESVGVSKAALYYHFLDKEALLISILEEYLEGMERLIDQARSLPGGSRQQVGWLVRHMLDEPAEERALIRLASQEMAQLQGPLRLGFQRKFHTRLLDRIVGLLRDGIERGELRPLDPSVAAWSLLGIMYPYFYPVHSGDVPPPDDVAEQLVTIYLDGMIQPEG